MGKFIGIFVLGFLCYTGITKLIAHFEDPVFAEMTIQEIDSNGTEGIEYIHLTGGMSTGEYVYNQMKSGAILGIKYPLVNLENISSTRDTTKARTKIVVSNSSLDSISFGIQEIKGKVKDAQLSSEEEKLFSETYDLDEDYIVIEDEWEKPGLWSGLLLTIIPGLLLLVNLKILFGGRKEGDEPQIVEES